MSKMKMKVGPEEREVEVWLEREPCGGVVLRASGVGGDDPRYTLAEFTKEGKLKRFEGVSGELGFQLDVYGRVAVE